MAEIDREIERLIWERDHGHGKEKIHITWVERDQAERIKNNKRVTKFVLETKDPDMCSELHAQWERIIKRIGNKSIALSLIHRALRDALADPILDQIMAQLDAVESGAPGPPKAEFPDFEVVE
jgi:hypothetical protein